jgi:hypothetical protein
MGVKGKEPQQDFIELVDLCIKKTRAINRLMGNLEAALKELNRQDSNEITLAAIQDVNDILNTLISTWDQWAVGVSKEMDILGQFKK